MVFHSLLLQHQHPLHALNYLPKLVYCKFASRFKTLGPISGTLSHREGHVPTTLETLALADTPHRAIFSCQISAVSELTVCTRDHLSNQWMAQYASVGLYERKQAIK